MKGLLEDVRHALRIYRRTPGASLLLVAVLAIGMAFVAAFLSLYSDLFLRPPPGFEKGGPIVSFSIAEFGGMPVDLINRIAEESTTLESAAGTTLQFFKTDEGKENAFAELVTAGFFSGVRPKLALGRGFSREEHDAEGEPVIVISWQYWQKHFGGRQDVLGKTLHIEPLQLMIVQGPGAPPPAAGDERPKDFRVIGVMSRGFVGSYSQRPETGTTFWMPVERGLPLTLPPQMAKDASLLRRMTNMRGIGRAAPGVRATAVARELNGRYAQEEVMGQKGVRYDVLDGLVLSPKETRSMRQQLRLFLGASVLLSLVAAANVSLFLLARAPGRRRELGIRMAVGAPLKRLARQLASEAAVLVVAGAALGLVLSIWLARFLRGLPFLRQAQWRDVTLFDWRVLLAVGVFLLLLALLVSLAPVLGLKRLGISASSKQVAARATFAQRIAGTAQIAIAGVLVAGAIAFSWHLLSLLLADPGYRMADLYAVPYSMKLDGPIRMENGQIAGVVSGVRQREAFLAIPGVTAAATGSAVPGVQPSSMSMSVPDPVDPQRQVRVRMVQIDSHYFKLLGIRLLHGRNIAEEGTAEAVVNQAYAQRFFGREDATGESMPFMPGSTRPTQIVGVIKDLPFGHPLAVVEPEVYAPSGLMTASVAVIQSRLPAAALQKAMRDTLRILDVQQAGNIEKLAKGRSNLLAADRARGLLTIGTAVLVVLLAVFGFYGTQRYLVTAGRREYAIRASLGAGPRALGRLVLRRGLMLGLPGLVLGVPLAYILVAWLRDNYVSRAISPLIVSIAVAAGIALLVLVSSAGPARLARRTQPAPLLRED